MTAEERRKASGPLIYWAAAAPAHRGAATVGAPFGAPPPSWGSKDVLGSKDMASRPFEASFLGKQTRMRTASRQCSSASSLPGLRW